ncbi:hypothetical protein L218DRAFT_930422 [Marasmius fiardii PR-910]|nr:hypothetical protein L218DRAFT_930422 [Marasmius fiardii PR-910]
MFFSRFRSRSRPPTSDDPHSGANNGSNGFNLNSDSAGDSPIERGADDRPPSSSPAQMSMSRDSEGYPSWLPQRPPPPAPASTFHSSVGFPEPVPSDSPAMVGGRRPTPRSIRIVSLEGEEFSEKDPVPPPAGTPGNGRVWSRGAVSALTPTVFSAPLAGDGPNLLRIPQPYFRSKSVKMDILRNPSTLFRIYFYFFPILVFAHIPLQTFFDFNAVFMLIQVARHPNPIAPGVPGSGKNWALGSAAYLACWLVWIVVVFLVYEIIYSFVRRWRTKRPPVFPLYTSSPTRHLVSLTSYSHFCFIHHIRLSAFIPSRGGSIRDGLAETFYFYAQNLPTVALLLPRAGLSLALLLAFWTTDPNAQALADQGLETGRDATFFHRDGTLTGYARGVLAANVAWTVWRTLVLMLSWIGLWILSGQAFAGLCGPRYRWEEDDLREKNRSSLYSLGDNNSETAHFDPDAPLPWSWKERTRTRVWDAYELCRTTKAPGRWGSGRMDPIQAYRYGFGDGKKDNPELPVQETPGGFDGMDRLMAAVGLMPASASAQQQKRSVLSDDFFQNPTLAQQPVASGSGLKSGRASPPPAGRATPPELAAVIPKVVQRATKEKQPTHGGPLMELPYPFTAKGVAQVSSEDVAKKDLRVPFPPSPSKSRADRRAGTATSRSEEEEEEEEEEEDSEEEERGHGTTSEDPSSSSARASNSMSSLGLPVTSRYPFQFRHPTTRGSSGSHMTPPSNGRSTIESRMSRQTRSTLSTGNVESSDSHSPRSHHTTSDSASPSSFGGVSGIPMPPRRQGGSRGRGGNPAPSVPSSPSIDLPRNVGARGRGRGGSHGSRVGVYGMSSPEPALYSSDLEGEYEDDNVEGEGFDDSIMMEQPEPEGPQEAAEGDDVVGLLSSSRGPSPRTSMTGIRQRASGSFGSARPTRLSLPGRSSRSSSSQGSRSGSSSRTNSHSGSSSGRPRAGSMTGAVRSRTQSLLQTMASASRSSVDLVQHTVMRSRANSSIARLEEDFSDRTHSRSGSSSSAMVSSGENNTFGHPIPRRSQWQQREKRVSEEEEPQTPGVPRIDDIPEVIEPAAISQSPSRALREVSSDLSGNAPSINPSETTMHGPAAADNRDEPSGGLAIPRQTPGSEHHEALSVQSSQADISTAAASFVTAPATIATTTDDSGRTVSSWPGVSHMIDRPDATWRPA